MGVATALADPPQITRHDPNAVERPLLHQAHQRGKLHGYCLGIIAEHGFIWPDLSRTLLACRGFALSEITDRDTTGWDMGYGV